MDYNEDRQVISDCRKKKDRSLVGRVVESDDVQHAYIYLDTVGKYINHIYDMQFVIQVFNLVFVSIILTLILFRTS